MSEDKKDKAIKVLIHALELDARRFREPEFGCEWDNAANASLWAIKRAQQILEEDL